MQVSMTFSSQNMSKDELRSLLQAIRGWELSTPRTEIDAFTFKTVPEMTLEEIHDIFARISPNFKNVADFPLPKTGFLSLGARGIVIDGALVGHCDELTLAIGAASEDDMKKLQEAHQIVLVRMGQG